MDCAFSSDECSTKMFEAIRARTHDRPMITRVFCNRYIGMSQRCNQALNRDRRDQGNVTTKDHCSVVMRMARIGHGGYHSKEGTAFSRSDSCAFIRNVVNRRRHIITSWTADVRQRRQIGSRQGPQHHVEQGALAETRTRLVGAEPGAGTSDEDRAKNPQDRPRGSS